MSAYAILMSEQENVLVTKDGDDEVTNCIQGKPGKVKR